MREWNAYNDGVHIGSVMAVGILSAYEAAIKKFNLPNDSPKLTVRRAAVPAPPDYDPHAPKGAPKCYSCFDSGCGRCPE